METPKTRLILANSEIEIFSNESLYGIILKATLKNNLKEYPYEMYDANHYGKSVKCILIKLMFLTDNNNNYTYKFDNNKKYTESVENFKKEVKIQTEIFLKTVDYLEPLCPAPVYSEILNEDNKNDEINRFIEKTKNSDDKKLLENIKNIKFPFLGILAMEIADDYKPFADFSIYSYNYIKFENMAKLQILNMALNTGYYQNDLHLNNILVNPKYTGMYQDIPGKVIIIDFGLAIKIDKKLLKIIAKYYENYEYQEALNILLKFFHSNDNNSKDYFENKWFYNYEFIKQNNADLLELKTQEYEATELRIDKINKKGHKLPLPNKEKQYFYKPKSINIKTLTKTSKTQTRSELPTTIFKPINYKNTTNKLFSQKLNSPH